jgi:3-deoxy-manno-octulosonate cytidylyltransferase (CMP-KDO synthetase)
MAEAIIVIPARFDSSRFPGKPLVPLLGRSLIARCIDAARATGLVAYVATDDARIMAEAEAQGCPAILTAGTCANGTERVCDAVVKAGLEAEVIVNLQGDAPLTPPGFVQALVAAMQADPACQIATPVLRCDDITFARLAADRAAGRVGGTTAVRDGQGRALYFSKELIPYTGGRFAPSVPVFHHVGLYAYRRAALLAYAQMPQGPLELSEGLEQLRFLENGLPVQTVEVPPDGRQFWEVNNPGDVPLVEAELTRLGLG